MQSVPEQLFVRKRIGGSDITLLYLQGYYSTCKVFQSVRTTALPSRTTVA